MNSNKSWNMDMTGFVPGFSDLVDEGYYLTEIVSADEDTADKGNIIKLGTRILEGPFAGKSLIQKMYVLDKDFSGSDGHGSATMGNWYSLFLSLGIKPGKFDARKVASKLIGKTVGVQVTHTLGTNKKTGAKVTYANIGDFLRPESISELASPSDDSDDSPEDEVLDAVAEAPKKKKAKKAKPEPEPIEEDDSDDSSDDPSVAEDSSDEDDSDEFDLDSLA